MKKILFVINTLGGAGAENAMLKLMEKLNPGEYEVSLYVLMGQGELSRKLPDYVKLLNEDYDDSDVLSHDGQKRLKKKVLKRLLSKGSVLLNMPYIIFNAVKMVLKGSLQPDKLLWKAMADGADRISDEYDMAVAYLEGGSTYYVSKHVKADKKVGFVHIDYEKAGYGPGLDKGCYETFSKIFTVSDEVKDKFLKIYPQYSDKTDVFHNIIDVRQIEEKAKENGGFDDSYDGTRILTVGRLTPQKAYEVAIEAMKLLKEEGIKARWYVVGEGQERNRLEQLIEKYDLKEDFVLLGMKMNPYPYYAQTDIYVHATRYEGKSIAIQEAQVLSCAILVSDCSGNREQVTHGVDGLMCDLSPKAVKDGIVKMLSDKEKMAEYKVNAGNRIKSEKSDLYKLTEILR